MSFAPSSGTTPVRGPSHRLTEPARSPGRCSPSEASCSEPLSASERAWSVPMNARILVSTGALLVSAYGITPAAAESFNDRGWDWTMASPMPAAAPINDPQTLASSRDDRKTSLPGEGSSTAWNIWTPLLEKGKTTSSQDRAHAASSADRATGQRCESPPRVGFNQRNIFPAC